MIAGIGDEEQVQAEPAIFYEDPPDLTEEQPVLDSTKRSPAVVIDEGYRDGETARVLDTTKIFP